MHYYPFGLTMAGISSKALNGVAENKKKFNDRTELNTDFDLNWYETNFRSLDPQLGRFWQIDPLALSSSNLTPYNYASNNPILRNDPYGLKDSTVNGEPVNTAPSLATVSVTGYTSQAKHNIYWNLVNNNIPFSRVKNDNLREWLYRQDGIQHHLAKIYQMQRQQDPIIYGTLFAPLATIFLSETAIPVIYQSGQVLIRVGSRLIPVDKIGFLLEDAQLRIWLNGNFVLNNLRSELLAACSMIYYKSNPGKWEKLMNQSAEFKDLMKPMIDYIQKKSQEPSGDLMQKANDMGKRLNDGR
ncbi:MAG TPA: RHS repeat-associated core domain-containing protein [Chitinophagaceae bacterium]|nr:RHS repeat-associated core domain-containing protein [Chitinophagaceae bacterium]